MFGNYRKCCHCSYHHFSQSLHDLSLNHPDHSQ
uniref:Uncharacterized protein n=1 Tax=Anguilla anguilla TaxID=7936 RepID=A0A0E9SIK2_ANGAN